MKDQAQTEEAPRIEIGSQTTNDLKIAGQKRGFRVLHVDDDPCILQVSKEILELEGNFEVDTALSVDEACKKLEQQTYDAVISDYEMPQKNGLQFLKELRQQKNGIPFVLFTGKGREEVAVTALNLGADGYYNKQGSPETVYGELAHGIRSAVSRRKAEEALRVSEENYSELIDGMNDTAWVIDLDANFIDVNDAAVKVLGYSREELLSMGPTDIDNSLSKEQIRDLVKRMPADQIQVFETAHTTKDGKTIPVEISSSLVTYQGKQAVLSIARNITERKKMVNALRESEEKYRRQFEEALDAIFVADAETGILVDCNPAACELVGREKTEIVGLHQRILHPPEENGGEFSRTFKEHLDKKEGLALESQVITKSGEIKDVAIKANIFTLGNKTLMQGSFRDVTDRKKAEGALDRTMNELVLVNEKLNVVGSLTRHDVRNKLCAVTGNAFLLKNKHADQADIVDGLGKMEQAVKEVGKIFDFAKMYEQLGVEELTYVDVEKDIGEAVALFSGPSNLKVINGCHGLTLLADSLLRQLFYNLIDNSLKHGEKVTKIRVHYEKVDQDKMIVVYEDDGVGISAVNKQQLFKEGFSTGGSTGFGLFLIRKMMDVYGWTIQEAGEPGKGAKFIITIPRISQNGKESFQITS
jgi:PAS domain S-box-containing protein